MPVDRRVRGSTGLLGVIGNPIAHTLSPQLHNTLSTLLGNDHIYIPMRVMPEELVDAVKGLKALNFIGFNVTIPHKSAVMELMDEVSLEAKLIGAVNTVRIDNDRLIGDNTDSEGFAASFKEKAGTGFKGKSVVVLGAGGTARTVSVKVILEEAQSVTILNRTISRAQGLVAILKGIAGGLMSATHPDRVGWGGLESAKTAGILREADIIINTTSAGMYPDIGDCPIPPEYCMFTRNQIIYDVIYNPKETMLLKLARNSGCVAINGLGMLFLQGVRAYEIWTGVKIDSGMLINAFKAFSLALNDLQ